MDYQDPVEFSQACLGLQKIMGQVSASITHEIKNQLAVIKEQAGLLGDLSAAARKKGGLDPERAAYLSGRIAERAGQADRIVRRFNRFAHASDEPLREMDAYEALGLMVDIYRRLADKKPVSLVLGGAPDAPLYLTTRPVFLLGALFACLEISAAEAPAGGEVTARAEQTDGGVAFIFSWNGADANPDRKLPAGLLAVLGARLESEPGGGGFELAMPRKWQGGLG